MALSDFEKNVIRLAAGLPQAGDEQDHITGWGAAVGAALGLLKRAGYLKAVPHDGGMTYEATDKGVSAVQEQER